MNPSKQLISIDAAPIRLKKKTLSEIRHPPIYVDIKKDTF